DGQAEPGAVVAVTPAAVAVQCGDGLVWIRALQPAGRKKMSAQEFLNGYRLEAGTKLERPAVPAAGGAGRGGKEGS
ncbi:MAG TPA: methionyl-tRNA formyltransferase, partial [Thermaerobacter sp.]